MCLLSQKSGIGRSVTHGDGALMHEIRTRWPIDVCLPPGNVRNDIYVTLVQGEFDRGKKKTPKNVEVMMRVLDDEGTPMEVRH